MARVQLDESLLQELGLDQFSEEDKEALLASIVEGLELRIGSRLAQELGEAKIDEFNKITEEGRDQDATKWLMDNVPNYEEIAKEELEKFKKEVKDTSRSVLENSI